MRKHYNLNVKGISNILYSLIQSVLDSRYGHFKTTELDMAKNQDSLYLHVMAPLAIWGVGSLPKYT